MNEDMLNVMGSFISTELDAFENLHKELEEKDKEIERLNNIINELAEENKQLKSQLQQKENIIKEVREEVRILESNCDISNYHAQKLYQTLDKEEVN